MLLSCILQILDRHQEELKTVENKNITPFEIEMAAAVEKASDPKDSENAGATTVKLPKSAFIQPKHHVSARNLECFIRAITKFEKQEKRVVDVFE